MKPGNRVDVLVAVCNDVRWLPGQVLSESRYAPAGDAVRYDVRLDDGRTFRAAHVDSMRAVVVESAL